MHRPGDAELDVVSQILAGGKNSRLYKRLVYDLQIAQDVSAFQASAALDSAVPDRRHVAARRCGRDARRRSSIASATIVDEELATLQKTPPAAREFERAINQIEASFYNRMESAGGVFGKGNQLNAYYFATGNPDYFNEDLSRYRSLTASDIQAAAAFWLPSNRRVELSVVPSEKAVTMKSAARIDLAAEGSRWHPGRRRSLCARPAGPAFVDASAAQSSAQPPPDRSAPPKPGPPPALKLPAIQKRTLSNGLPVWIVELHKVPVVHVSLVVKAGSGADVRNKFGVAHLTAEMLDEGAGARDALQIADGIDYLGANLSTSSTFDAAFVDLHVPVARLGDALPIMADVALRPTFPEKELQRVREELLTSIVQAQDDPEALVQFAFPRLVFGPQHRYGTMSFGTAASLKSFTVADLRQFHAASLRPVERGAHRDRRRHAGLRRRATGIRVRRLEGDGSRRRSRTARAAVDVAQGVPDRQAGRRAVRRSASAGSACRDRRPTTSRFAS